MSWFHFAAISIVSCEDVWLHADILHVCDGNPRGQGRAYLPWHHLDIFLLYPVSRGPDAAVKMRRQLWSVVTGYWLVWTPDTQTVHSLGADKQNVILINVKKCKMIKHKEAFYMDLHIVYSVKLCTFHRAWCHIIVFFSFYYSSVPISCLRLSLLLFYSHHLSFLTSAFWILTLNPLHLNVHLPGSVSWCTNLFDFDLKMSPQRNFKQFHKNGTKVLVLKSQYTHFYYILYSRKKSINGG